MSLSSLSIKRPVLTIVSTLLILIMGFIGLSFLGVREYPSVDPPIITVTTSYVGANADIIETQITEVLEQYINGIAGIRSISSVSRDGSSNITVEFTLEIDLETAANDVRDKVSQATRQLPADVDPPIVTKADADSNPIIILNISASARSLMDLSEFAENVYKERLQTISGVSSVAVWGGQRYSMRLRIDPARLAAYSLTPLDVRNAMLRENIELPSGRIEGQSTELTVRTMGRFQTPADFNNMVIKEADNQVVRMSDIGFAELASENERTILKLNGVPMIACAIIPQPGSNHIEISDEIYKRLAQIEKDLPPDIQAFITFDNTKYIRESITEVEQTIIIAFLLVILIIFLFLREWRSTFIPVIVIPVSLIGAFFIMYAANFSINVLTLLGIVLAIGLVVDDAIVVLENIYTKIEKGMTPLEAGIKGASEIFFAVIATTITLIAVFFPIIFLQGVTGRLFREFGVVIAGAVGISAFLALTLTPMLSVKILKPHTHHNWLYRKTEPFFEWINNGYRKSLTSFLKKRYWAVIIMVIAFASIFLIGKYLPSEMAPLEDRSALVINSVAPEGIGFEYMNRYMDDLTKIVQSKTPEAERLITITAPGSSGSVNSGIIRMILKDPDERERSQQEIFDDLSNQTKQLTGARTFISQQQTIGGRRAGLPVQYVIQAQDLDDLKKKLPDFMAEASQSPIFQVVDLNLKFNKPELRVKINREKAILMGVSTQDIAQTLQLALSGQRFGYFIMNGKQYQVIGQLTRENRNDPLDLKSMYVRSGSGKMVQLDNLVTLQNESSPPQLYRYNRLISATVSAGLVKGRTIGEGIEEMNNIASRVLDETYSTALAGDSKEFAESSSSLLFAFLLAIVLIYLVLAAQFESFRDPLIIMFTVPLALSGSLIFLWYFNQTINIFSQIGMIMLIGLVSKNGILIVEFANQRKAAGLGQMEAIIDASVSRFRPILMTSLATILGALPIALALGAGSESRVSMGIVVVFGLSISTSLTLYVVPAIYSYISEKKKDVSNVTEEESKKPDNV
jgi:multidrug efflux pump